MGKARSSSGTEPAMTEFERGVRAAVRYQPGLHHALPPGAQQLLREAAAVGSYLSTERHAAIAKAQREIRERWPELFREVE